MEVKRQMLLDIVNKLQPAVANSDVVEQADAIVFLGGEVLACNDEIAISHPCDELGELEGAVPCAELQKLLSRLKKDTMTVDVVDDELRIKCGRTKAAIRMEEVTMPLNQLEPPEDKEWSDLPEGFSDALGTVFPTVAPKDSSKTILQNVHYNGKVLESCDNWRLTRTTVGKKVWPSVVLIPGGACPLLVKFNPVCMAVTDNWIHWSNEDDLVFSHRAVSGDYPVLDAMLEKEGVELHWPEDTEGALERAGVFTVGRFTHDEYVHIELSAKKMVVRARNDVGWIEENLPLKDGVDDVTFSVHPAVLQHALQQSDTINVGERTLFLKGKGFVHCVSLSVKG